MKNRWHHYYPKSLARCYNIHEGFIEQGYERFYFRYALDKLEIRMRKQMSGYFDIVVLRLEVKL